MQQEKISRESIRTFVMMFYSKLIKDETVGPFFIAKLGDDMESEEWQTHLEVIVVFWTSLAFGTPKYKGALFLPHTHLGNLQRETFEQWLKLFGETLDEVYIPSIATIFKNRARLIATNFMRNLGIPTE